MPKTQLQLSSRPAERVLHQKLLQLQVGLGHGEYLLIAGYSALRPHFRSAKEAAWTCACA